jgi:SAM-dependent methyltransferase/GNAT superfamily N-acetyltransferase
MPVRLLNTSALSDDLMRRIYEVMTLCHAEVSAEEPYRSLADAEAFLSHVPDLETRDYWITESDGHCVGFAQLGVSEGSGRVEILVRPDARQQGHGTALLDIVREQAKLRGARRRRTMRSSPSTARSASPRSRSTRTARSSCRASIGGMVGARYDGLAAWYEEFRPALSDEETAALERLLGHGHGRCLDLGCGTGLASAAVARLGWSVVGVDVSGDLLEVARGRALNVLEAPASSLPFDNASFDAAVSVLTHTDIDEFAEGVAETARVLKPGALFVYIGVHPCFVGPHSVFVAAEGIPEFHPGYRPSRRYDISAPGVANPDGVRARVGAAHLTLHDFFGAFTAAGFRIERFEELGDRDYPHLVALRAVL